MIRKGIIVLLTLGAVLALVASVVSLRGTVGYIHNNMQVRIAGGAFWADDFSYSSIRMRQSWFDASPSPFSWMPAIGFRGATIKHVRIPLWLLSLLLLAYPTIAFVRGPLRRWRRGKKGLCLNCGYNLTGLPEPRCPECGTEIKQP